MSDSLEDMRSAIDEADGLAERCRRTLALAWRLDQLRSPETLQAATDALRLARRCGEVRLVAESHVVLGSACCNAGQLEAARLHFESGVTEAQAAGALVPLAQAHRGLGYVMMLSADYTGAALKLAHALEIAEESGDELQIANLNNALGAVLFKVGDFTTALPLLHRAIDLYASHGMLSQRAGVMNNVGNTVFDLGDVGRALEYFDEALALSRSVGDVRGEIRAGSNRANALGSLGRLDEAVRQCRAVISLSESIGSETDLAIAFGQLSYIYNKMGRHDRALAYAERSAAAASANLMSELLHTTLVAADANHALGNHALALELLDDTLSRATERGERGTMLEVLEKLAAIHDERGETALAYDFHKRHAAIAHELTGAEQQRTMMAIELKREIEAARRERENHRAEAERLRAEMEAKNQELAAMALQLVERTTFIGELGDEIADAASNVDDSTRASMRSLARKARAGIDRTAVWIEFDARFRQVHPKFRQMLLERCERLSKTEIRVSALLKIGLSTKEIAEILAASERTVEWHRSNLRAKLGLAKDANLSTFFGSL